MREGEGEGDAKSYKEEFQALQKRLQRLEKEERSLEEDMHIADLEPGQATRSRRSSSQALGDGAEAPPSRCRLARALSRSLQAQKQLLEKVKKMNAQTAELDGVAKDMKGSIAAQKKQLQELANELAERKGARAAAAAAAARGALALALARSPVRARGRR